VIGWLLGGLAATYGGGALYAFLRRDLLWAPYPSPEQAGRFVDDLVRLWPALCAREDIGRSHEGRPIVALRLRPPGATAAPASRPRLLLTGHIHAVELIGAYVVRAVAAELARGYGHDPAVTALLDRADVWVVPLLNPDGAGRVWRRRGWCTLSGARVTARGVDPNRNFPVAPVAGRSAWNSGRGRPGSAYYRGPRPLSEPECLALARLCVRERFCAAVNFHSFGGVVFMPEPLGPDAARAQLALDVFRGPFQSRQRFRRYRPVPEAPARIAGQLDAFLLYGLGAPSVTVEVSRLGWHLLHPARASQVFWWANPSRPERWAANDVPATLHALAELLDRTGGEPCTPAFPEMAAAVADGADENGVQG